MKKSLIGSFCMALCLGWVSPGRAQQQPPQTPPPQEQAPPQDQEEQPKNYISQPPPLPPKAPDVRMPGETGWYVGLTGWFPTQQPAFNNGRASDGILTYPSNVRLMGTPKIAGGIEIGIAVGAHNTLRISGFEASATGDFITPVEISLPSQTYTAGTLVSTSYRLRNVKLSYEYLTWPYPVESRHFRLRTLWQVQFTDVRTAFDAPLLPLVDTNGNPLVNSSTGQPVDYSGAVDHWFFSPTFGLGATEYVSSHLRLELDASGFGIPRHTDIWDADASANFRVGHFELRVGAKAFHWKTSTNADFYTRNTMASAFVGIRVNLD